MNEPSLPQETPFCSRWGSSSGRFFARVDFENAGRVVDRERVVPVEHLAHGPVAGPLQSKVHTRSGNRHRHACVDRQSNALFRRIRKLVRQGGAQLHTTLVRPPPTVIAKNPLRYRFFSSTGLMLVQTDHTVVGGTLDKQANPVRAYRGGDHTKDSAIGGIGLELEDRRRRKQLPCI